MTQRDEAQIARVYAAAGNLMANAIEQAVNLGSTAEAIANVGKQALHAYRAVTRSIDISSNPGSYRGLTGTEILEAVRAAWRSAWETYS